MYGCLFFVRMVQCIRSGKFGRPIEQSDLCYMGFYLHLGFPLDAPRLGSFLTFIAVDQHRFKSEAEER